MIAPSNSLYAGTVVHKRLAPVRHQLRYRVFNLLADVDELDRLGLKWLSHNRRNIVSIYDSDHGKGDGSPIGAHLRGLLAEHEDGHGVRRIFMFCYPRVLGFAFNPLTVYFCYDSEDCVTFIIYEVNNTFGHRRSYVIPAPRASAISQSHAKELFVSPFNAVEGRYGFHVKPPGDGIVIGVALRNALGPCLNAYVTGTREDLTDRALIRHVLAMPLMTFKVVAGIHWEALKLWLKGLRLKPRETPSAPHSIAKTAHDR